MTTISACKEGFNKFLCKVFGHKINAVELCMFEIELNAIGKNFKSEITCPRCKTTWREQ